MIATKMTEQYKLKQWQRELKSASEYAGLSLTDICEYLGLSYARDIGFYVKLPKKRRTFIGIGMALHQPLDVINHWITYYGAKRRLYSKDIAEDMVWIYLIRLNENDQDHNRNYYKFYDECQQAAFETYMTIWSAIISGSQNTSDMDRQLANISVSDEITTIKEFVSANIDSFKTAYSRPRKMLARYTQCILEVNGRARGKDNSDSLISLRGWLDDSMINYLSGSAHTSNVTDRITGQRAPQIKKIPKSRRAHISLALALGMTREEIDHYLVLMGYLPLSDSFQDEDILIRELDRWDEEHPLQRMLKEKYIIGNDVICMDPEDELQAVNDMLMLRQELREQFKRRKIEFDYMKV